MTIYRYQVAAPAPGPGSVALVLVFAPSRGRVLRAEIEAGDPRTGEEWITAVPVPERGTSWRFSLRGIDLSGRPSVTVRLRTADEPLSPSYFVEDLGTQRRIWTDDDSGPFAGPRKFTPATSDSPLNDLLVNPADSSRALGRLVGQVSALQRYFVLLELASNSEVGDVDPAIRQQIDVLTQHLERRVRQRAVIARIDPARAGEALMEKPSPTLRQCIQALSTKQLGLVDGCFGIDAKFRLEEFQTAFESFANGQFRTPYRVPGTTIPAYHFTEPSSAYYLFFAEFAYLACECGIDAQRWKVLANAMTYTQEVFARVYGPPSHVNAHFRDFRAVNFRPNKQLTVQAIGALRKSAEGLDLRGLRALAAKTVKKFVPPHGAALVPK